MPTKENRHTGQYLVNSYQILLLRKFIPAEFYGFIIYNASSCEIVENYPHMFAYSCAADLLNLLAEDITELA